MCEAEAGDEQKGTSGAPERPQPLRQAEEVASTIAFLRWERASYITGVSLSG